MVQMAFTAVALLLVQHALIMTGTMAMTITPVNTNTKTNTSTNVATRNYDLLVIGGGSAGLTAAKFAATFGKTVAIIEKERLGGDCTWTGCVPSKSLIAASKAAHAVRKASTLGINVKGGNGSIDNNDTIDMDIDMKKIKKRIQSNINYIYEEDDSPDAMKKLGIDTIVGTATIVKNNEEEEEDDQQQKGKGKKQKRIQMIKVKDEKSGEISCTVRANDGILICTGAKPMLPLDTVPGLESIPYLTYEQAFDIEEVPASLTIVGGGPIGVELAQAYSRLGSKVTVITKDRLLPKEEPEVGDALQRVFNNEGITVVNSNLSRVQPVLADESGKVGETDQSSSLSSSSSHFATCQNGETVTGDMILVATGRKPVVHGMGLSEIGIEFNDAGGIQVDEKLQTSVGGIYAAGDCTGGQQFTHYAGYQGAVGARNILLPFSDPGKMEFVPGTTFTDPQVASVGLTEEAAKEQYGEAKIGIAFKEIKETDRGICDNIDEGFIKVVYLKRGYKILGACIMSPVAGELIAEICVAMKSGMSFDMLATVIHTYPSHSFALQAMAAELYYDKLVKLRPILNFLKWIGL